MVKGAPMVAGDRCLATKGNVLRTSLEMTTSIVGMEGRGAGDPHVCNLKEEEEEGGRLRETTATVHCIAIIREVPCIKSECAEQRGMAKRQYNLDGRSTASRVSRANAIEITLLNSTPHSWPNPCISGEKISLIWQIFVVVT